jgi:hypothetical protein
MTYWKKLRRDCCLLTLVALILGPIIGWAVFTFFNP